MIARRTYILGIFIPLLIVVVGFIALHNTGRQPDDNDTSTVQSRVDVPDLALKDLNGNEVELHAFIGTPLVINSWAVWCPFCQKEIPDFVAVQKEFKERVKIIAVDRAEPLQTVKEYTDELGVTNDLLFLLDPSDSFYRAISGFAMPETIFVDAKEVLSGINGGRWRLRR